MLSKNKESKRQIQGKIESMVKSFANLRIYAIWEPWHGCRVYETGSIVLREFLLNTNVFTVGEHEYINMSPCDAELKFWNIGVARLMKLGGDRTSAEGARVLEEFFDNLKPHIDNLCAH